MSNEISERSVRNANLRNLDPVYQANWEKIFNKKVKLKICLAKEKKEEKNN